MQKNNFNYTSKDQVIEAAKLFVCESPVYANPESAISCPKTALDILKLHHPIGSEHEVFSVLFLNSKNQVICFKEMFNGSINSAQIYPRTIAQEVLRQNAARVVLCHNHPSGDCQPSESDKSLTQQLIKVLKLVDCDILDHFILSKSDSFGFAANQLI